MNFKTDKEDEYCDDIAFLSEIITNFIFWLSLSGIKEKKPSSGLLAPLRPVGRCLDTVPCDPCPHLQPTSG